MCTLIYSRVCAPQVVCVVSTFDAASQVSLHFGKKGEQRVPRREWLLTSKSPTTSRAYSSTAEAQSVHRQPSYIINGVASQSRIEAW